MAKVARPLLRSALVAACVLLAAACSQVRMIDDPDDIRSLARDDDTVTLVFWHTYSDEETKVFEQKLLPLFEERHPGIAVEAVRQPYSTQLKTVLFARASSRKPPDVIRMDIAWAPEYIRLGLAHPLNGLDGFADVRRQLYPAALKTSEYEGKLYGLPLNVNTKASIYNKEALERIGLNPETSTLEQVVSAAEQYGLAIRMSDLSLWGSLPFLYGMGGSFMDASHARASGYLDSPETVRAVERLKLLTENGVLKPSLFYTQENVWEDIYAGHYLMFDDGPWFFSINLHSGGKARMDEKLRLAPFPVSNGYGSVIGGEALVISKGTRHLDAAWRFVRWMASEEAQRYVDDMGLIPTHVGLLEELRRDDSGFVGTYARGLEHAFYRPLIPHLHEAEQIYTDAMRRIFLGDIAAEEGLAQAAAQIDALSGPVR